MNKVAIIPARSGSKRIPRKNIRNFNGKPIIAYAIMNALESNLFDSVIVSTDSQEIADISKSFGAKTPWLRSPELSDEFTTTVQVMKDAVDRIGLSVGDNSMVCCIYPATPLLQAVDIDRAFRKMSTGLYDYVFSAVRTPMAPERSFRIKSENELRLMSSLCESTRTQDLTPAYYDAGQFYWGTANAWQSAKPIFSSKSGIIELPQHSVVDIDELSDWQYAEVLYKTMRNG